MILEIRTYRLRPGSSRQFVRAMHDAAPLQEQVGIRVVGYGISLAAEDGHEEAYLIREFDSLASRETLQQRFYGSDAWRDGPRSAVLDAIENYHTVVMENFRLVVAGAGDAPQVPEGVRPGSAQLVLDESPVGR